MYSRYEPLLNIAVDNSESWSRVVEKHRLSINPLVFCIQIFDFWLVCCLSYPDKPAWPPWRSTSWPAGDCRCPENERWAALSPDSAAGALTHTHTHTPVSHTVTCVWRHVTGLLWLTHFFLLVHLEAAPVVFLLNGDFPSVQNLEGQLSCRHRGRNLEVKRQRLYRNTCAMIPSVTSIVQM